MKVIRWAETMGRHSTRHARFLTATVPSSAMGTKEGYVGGMTGNVRRKTGLAAGHIGATVLP
jgi:hypothetical protein